MANSLMERTETEEAEVYRQPLKTVDRLKNAQTMETWKTYDRSIV